MNNIILLCILLFIIIYMNYYDKYIKYRQKYQLLKLEEMINGLHKMTIPTNGIIFYPKVSGINIIFVETKTDKVNINTQNTEIIENN